MSAFGVLDPGDTADHVGAERHRLPHQFFGPGLAHEAVLRERHELQLEPVAPLLLGAQARLEALEPGLGVDVDERADMGGAGQHGVGERPVHAFQHFVLAIATLDLGGLLDGRHGPAHALVEIAGGGLLEPVDGVDLVEMELGDREALAHEVAGRVQLARGGIGDGGRDLDIAAVADGDVDQLAGAAFGVADDEVPGHNAPPPWESRAKCLNRGHAGKDAPGRRTREVRLYSRP